MIEKQYLGVVTKGTDGTLLYAIYPEGTFSIVSQAGALALQPIGAEKAMAVDKVLTFKNLDEATAWIQNPT